MQFAQYGAKVYLVLAPELLELHASLQELILVSEISLVSCIECITWSIAYLVPGLLLPYLA